MAIVGRDFDVSERKNSLFFTGAAGSTNIATGVTVLAVGPLAYPGTLQSISAWAAGLSGAPALTFFVARYANGYTGMVMSISNMILNNSGASGPLGVGGLATGGYSGLAIPGSTLLNLLAGDVLSFSTSVANTATTFLALDYVIKKTQDIVSFNGVSS